MLVSLQLQAFQECIDIHYLLKRPGLIQIVWRCKLPSGCPLSRPETVTATSSGRLQRPFPAAGTCFLLPAPVSPCLRHGPLPSRVYLNRPY